MKKHSFLVIDYRSTVKLPPSQERELRKWLGLTGKVLETLMEQEIIPSRPRQLEVSLLVCGDARIRRLNNEFRHKDKVTDVLSFPAFDNLRRTKHALPVIFLGDLAICHQQTKRQADEFKLNYHEEFIHLFFHGLLHLMGYDHELSRKEEKLMQHWEDEALRIFSVHRTKKLRNA